MVAPVSAQSAAIVVLGDSISAAYGLDNPDLGWVTLLQKQARDAGYDVDVVNAGISGDTSAGGLSRIDGLLERHRPAILILELGANDGLRGFLPDRTQATLGEIITRAKAKNAKVLLLGMRIPPNYGKRFNDLFEAIFPALARQHDIAYVPFLLEGVGGQDHLMQEDRIHPNAQAQPVLMQRVWQYLQPLLGQPALTKPS